MRRLLVSIVVIIFGCSHLAQGQSSPDSTDVLRLNRVIIIGNKRTKDWIIHRELSLKQADTVLRYQLAKLLERDKNKIYNLRIFHTAKLQALELPDKTFDLLVEVEERWFTFPIPIFELSDRNFNEWWENYDHKLNRTNYGLRLYQYNFRGRNETIRLTAQFGFTRKFDLIYRIPYIDKKQKQGLIFEFDYGEPKNLAYQTLNHKLVFLSNKQALRRKFGVGVTYTYRKSFYETHGITADYYHATIADTILSLNVENNNLVYFSGGSNKQWFTSLSYSFTSEHRDVIAYPLNGYQIHASFRKIGLGLGENVNQTILTASLAYHKHLGRNFYLSNFTSGYFSTPTSQPYSLYTGLGYRKQFVRGYEIYVIEGPWYGLNKTTLKKRLFNKIFRMEAFPWEQFKHLPVALYLKGHADFGYAENYPFYQSNNINTTLSSKLIAGAGMGLDLVTSYDGVMRFEYTFNSQGAHGFFFHLKKEF